jgi:hypothetical protein
VYSNRSDLKYKSEICHFRVRVDEFFFLLDIWDLAIVGSRDVKIGTRLLSLAL